MDLIIESLPTYNTSSFSDLPDLFFENFTQTTENIIIGKITLEYTDEDYCKDNNFFFLINIQEMPARPLLSTICEISLAYGELHKIAKCAIPSSSNNIKCNVDVSETKFFENDNITILAQDLLPCENGKKLNIMNDANNKLIIKEECWNSINNTNNNSQMFFLNELFSLLLYLILI